MHPQQDKHARWKLLLAGAVMAHARRGKQHGHVLLETSCLPLLLCCMCSIQLAVVAACFDGWAMTRCTPILFLSVLVTSTGTCSAACLVSLMTVKQLK